MFPMNNVVLAKENIVFPLWDNVKRLNISLTKNNNTLEIVSDISTSGFKEISGTIYLEKYTNGRWSQVNSWSISGTGALVVSKSYRGTSGNTYRARVSIIEQDRLDHLEHYVEIINKLAKSDIERIKENFNVSSENKTLSSYSLIDAPRGAVATNRNEYATSTYVFIPHNQIDSVLAGHTSGIISFAYATVASWYA